MEAEIKIKNLDETIEKVSRLVELLKEAQKLITLLGKNKKSEERMREYIDIKKRTENKSIRKRTKNIEKIHLKIYVVSETEEEARRDAKKISEMIQRENHLAKNKMSYEIKVDFT